MALAAKITVTTAGTAVQGPDLGRGTFLIHPDPAIGAGFIYVGNTAGDVDSTNGYKMGVGETAVVTGKLDDYWFDASANGLIAYALKMEGYNAA